MRTEIRINRSADEKANYISWSPAPSTIRLAESDDATAPVTVRLRNQNAGPGGQVVFYTALAGTGLDELRLSLPPDGSPVDFFVAGKFLYPSTADKDAAIEVIDESTGGVLSVTQLMVRIRKNANNLSEGERKRFLSALALLNDKGMGLFSDFRKMHTRRSSDEAHGDAGFMPWHRAYLLDLERMLQQIDASVTLPYWKFDEPAPKMFSPEFLGVPDEATGLLRFDPTNPLQYWVTDGKPGISRLPEFDTATQAPDVLDERETLLLGESEGSLYISFLDMEINPHGDAHTSFSGPVSSVPTAARDPLFFLLHCNVDRLWAKWQWYYKRFNTSDTAAYTYLGKFGVDPGAARIGHNLQDTMWPWNGDITDPRPPSAPGGDFAVTVTTSAPGLQPIVGDMIDYQGVRTPSTRLNFDYDDVPFQL
jgi:tyrosinase